LMNLMSPDLLPVVVSCCIREESRRESRLQLCNKKEKERENSRKGKSDQEKNALINYFNFAATWQMALWC
jgi:hypothetical protein